MVKHWISVVLCGLFLTSIVACSSNEPTLIEITPDDLKAMDAAAGISEDGSAVDGPVTFKD